MDIGIVSYGLYLPTLFETADQVAARAGLVTEEVRALGIERKLVPEPDDQPIPMAVKAANQAFAGATEVRPTDVDVVIWTGEEYKDYIAQTASIRLQEEVGCRNAWAFDLVGQGVTLLQGLRIAHDLMIGDESVNTVLLAGGTRNIDLVDYANPNTRFLLASSASGGAMLLKRNHRTNQLLETAFVVDSQMADEICVPGGGTEIPFGPDNLNSTLMFYQVAHPERMVDYLDRRWAEALALVAKKVISGRSLDYFALRHVSAADRRRILGELAMTPEQSESLSEWGHHGPNDVIISLTLGLKSGAIQDGSLIAMTSGGIGFTYAAALFKWGQPLSRRRSND